MTIVVGVLVLCALHEAAHAAAAQALGLRWETFARLPWKVGVRVYDPSPHQSKLIAVAGPAANVAVGVPLLFTPWLLLGLFSLFLATVPSMVDWLAFRSARRAQ